ncbi:hypothetical protein [Pseudonocardia sp. Ae717_Ps2]|uniref:hypothetical protein n=1 Tax=Pseudonocardia sp. Ae717_Ps2 TaxID=1885573 RepID=UPI00094AB50C|nr:hypothetical protein [Pseudonocardia sp. Ae717_Ps2]
MTRALPTTRSSASANHTGASRAGPRGRVAEAREHALLGTDPPCLREPRDIWELVHEMSGHLDTRRSARDKSADLDVDDLELAP